MTNKDCNFCDQILQVVAILDKKLKVFIFFFKNNFSTWLRLSKNTKFIKFF